MIATVVCSVDIAVRQVVEIKVLNKLKADDTVLIFYTPQRHFPKYMMPVITCIFNVKVPDGPVFKWYIRGRGHSDVFKVLGAKVPVLLTFYLEKERFG